MAKDGASINLTGVWLRGMDPRTEDPIREGTEMHGGTVTRIKYELLVLGADPMPSPYQAVLVKLDTGQIISEHLEAVTAEWTVDDSVIQLAGAHELPRDPEAPTH